MDKGAVIGGLAGLGVGVVIGKFTSALGTAIPQHLVDIAKNLKVTTKSGECILQPLIYHKFQYRWGAEGNPIYTRKSGVFGYLTPKFQLPDGTTKFDDGGDLDVVIEIIDWTEEVPNKIAIDVSRVDTAEIQIIYKEQLLFSFPEIPITPLTVQPGYARFEIDLSTGNVI